MIHSHAFSRTSRQLHVITSCFDWFTWLSVSFVICKSDCSGFGFTILNWKPLWQLLKWIHLGVVKLIVLHLLRYTTGLKKLAPLFHPIKRKTNSDAFARVFPRFTSATYSEFQFWFVHCIASVFCDWLEWLLWFWFCVTQLKTPLRSYIRTYIGKNLSLLLLLLIVALCYLQCCSHVYNLMLLKCRTLHALKFALVSKSEAMHHLALENMKNLKVNILFVAMKKSDLYRTKFCEQFSVSWWKIRQNVFHDVPTIWRSI